MELCNQIDGLISCKDESSPIGFRGFGSSNSLDSHDLPNQNPVGQITNNDSHDILKGIQTMMQAMLTQLKTDITNDMDSKINKLGQDMDSKINKLSHDMTRRDNKNR